MNVLFDAEVWRTIIDVRRMRTIASSIMTNRTGLKWRLLSGLFWVLVSAVVSQGAGMLRAALPARILGIESYGRYVTIQNTLIMLASFAGLGLGTTATRYVSQLRQVDPQRAGRILGFCNIVAIVSAGLISLVLLLFSSPIALRLLGSDGFGRALQIGALYVFFFTINGYQTGALLGLEGFATLAWATSAYAVLSVAIVVGMAYVWGLTGGVAGMGLAAVLAWAIHGIALRNQCRRHGIIIQYRTSLREGGVFRQFAVPSALSGIIGGIVTAGGSALLIRGPDGPIQAAIFGAATTIRTVALFAPSLMARVTLPVLSNLQGTRSGQPFRRTFVAGLLGSSGSALAAVVILAACAPLLLHFFGSGFAAGRIVVVLSLGSVVFEVIGNNLYQVLYTNNRVWTQLGIVTIWAAIILGGTILLAPRYGAAALAFSYCIAWVCSDILYALVGRGLQWGAVGMEHFDES